MKAGRNEKNKKRRVTQKEDLVSFGKDDGEEEDEEEKKATKRRREG